MASAPDPLPGTGDGLAGRIAAALAAHDLLAARSLVFHWLSLWSETLPPQPTRQQLRQPLLWACLADVVERTHDDYLIERLWQILDRLPVPERPSQGLPLLGVPILNRPDLLQRLLDSLDHPVEVLAIVDNSIQPDSATTTTTATAVSSQLDALRQLGHPLIEHIRIARPFHNIGVAASWNLILSSFPQASLALLANNDVQLAPGVLASALQLLDSNRPQFLPLLPEPNGFSAFCLTALCWDRLGLFDAGFHPAYGEDLDYRDRLRADPAVEQLDGGFAHAAMQALNPDHSTTIASDPELRRYNTTSFALNRLWYLSHRRLRQDPRGSWRRLWLAQWSD